MRNRPNGAEQLALIHEMISLAKSDFKDDGFFYLLWGWLVFVASISNYILVWLDSPFAPLPWMALPVIGLTATFWEYRKRERNTRVTTYIHQLMRYFWMAFGISLLLVLIAPLFHVFSTVAAMTISIILYGLATFVMGGVFKFRPLLVGGILCWCIAIASFFVPSEHILLLLALAIAVSYLIPGYLLRIKTK